MCIVLSFSLLSSGSLLPGLPAFLPPFLPPRRILPFSSPPTSALVLSRSPPLPPPAAWATPRPYASIPPRDPRITDHHDAPVPQGSGCQFPPPLPNRGTEKSPKPRSPGSKSSISTRSIDRYPPCRPGQSGRPGNKKIDLALAPKAYVLYISELAPSRLVREDGSR